MVKLFLAIGSVSAALSIVLGAFAAHALRSRLGSDALAAFQTGVQYQLYHSLGLILVAVLMLQLQATGGPLKYAGALMLTGIVLFSGSLYGLSLFAWKWLGPLTPLGGLAFMAAWLLLAIGTWRSL